MINKDNGRRHTESWIQTQDKKSRTERKARQDLNPIMPHFKALHAGPLHWLRGPILQSTLSWLDLVCIFQSTPISGHNLFIILFADNINSLTLMWRQCFSCQEYITCRNVWSLFASSLHTQVRRRPDRHFLLLSGGLNPCETAESRSRHQPTTFKPTRWA